MSIVYISHKLEELMRIGDYITVLRDGHKVAEAPMSEVDALLDRRAHGRARYGVDLPRARSTHSAMRSCASKGITLPKIGGGYLLDHVSFSLRAGEILGIYGLMGAGRTELFECLMGLHPTATATVWLAQ